MVNENEDGWLKTSDNDNNKSEIPANNDLLKECEEEAEKVFRFSAIKYITENFDEFDLSSTYKFVFSILFSSFLRYFALLALSLRPQFII